MPKLKTNKSASKRFKVTGKGKIKRAQANTSHNTAKRRQKRMRKLRQIVKVHDNDKASIQGMLPYIAKAK